MNVLVAIPTRGWIYYKIVNAIGELRSMGFIVILSQSSYGVEAARGRLCRYFLKFPDYTHLMFLDDDIIPPSDIIARLLGHNVDMVSANYPVMYDGMLRNSASLKVGTGKDVPYVNLHNDASGLTAVDGVGLGACLIKRKVIEECMKERCFAMDMDDEYEVSKGEDYKFCETAKKKGFNIYVDCDIKCEHYKNTPLKGNHYGL